MKEQIINWLEEDNREYQENEHPQLNWLIQLKHGDRTVLLGNPEENKSRLEIVYKLNISPEHKEIFNKLDANQKVGFEKTLVMMLAEDSTIYNISRDDQNVPNSVIIKKHLYEQDLGIGVFFDTVQQVVNIGMRATIHFQSLGGSQQEQEDVSSTKSGPSLYR
ncbi:MAG: DUF2299 family protein [Thermoplasmatota archaeon]